MNKIAIIIPSRLKAQRLANKPLKLINNKEMILHVYEAATKSNSGEVYIATPDEEIIKVVKKFGKACSYPGTFMGSIHAIVTSNNYKSAIIKTIKAGGCNCSRANFVGAYFAALKGFENIPSSWIKKTFPAKNILKYI